MAEGNGTTMAVGLDPTQSDHMAENGEVGREFGTSGLNRWSGYVSEEFLKSLKDYRGKAAWREMSDNDPVVGAILFAIKMAIRQVEWTADQGDGTEEDTEFLRQNMEDMSFTWNDFISEVLSMLPFGYSFFETVYKYRRGTTVLSATDDSLGDSKFNDGKIGWRKFGSRAQETTVRWEFDENGGIKGMYQQAPPNYAEIFIPIEKSVLFRTEIVKNNPEGRSILRNAFRPWFFKKNIEEIEGIGIERDLAGLPKLQPPPGIDLWSEAQTENRQRAERLIRNIRNDEQAGVLIPPGWELELLASAGGKGINVDNVIHRYDQRIAMSVLAQFIMAGADEVGSYSLGESQHDLFMLSLTGWVDHIAETLNRYCVPKLFWLNGSRDLSKLPKIVHSNVGGPTLNELAGFVTRLASVGVLFPDTNLDKYLRTYAKLPENSGEAIESPVLRVPGFGGIPEPEPAAPAQANGAGRPKAPGGGVTRQPPRPDARGRGGRRGTKQAEGRS